MGHGADFLGINSFKGDSSRHLARAERWRGGMQL